MDSNDEQYNVSIPTYITVCYAIGQRLPISIDCSTTKAIYLNTPMICHTYATPRQAIKVAQRYERLLKAIQPDCEDV